MDSSGQGVEVDAKIDYLSFTVMVDVRQAGQGDLLESAVIEALQAHHPQFVDGFAQRVTWSSAGGRGHYSAALFSQASYATIRFGGTANHILVEMPGTACSLARDEGCLDQIVEEAAQRLTRLDVAVDIPGGGSPREFVQAGYNDRFKSYAEIVSESGITEYVGSMKSERYPRAGTLRVEFVLRSDYAKAAATVLQTESTTALAERLGNSFGWLSQAWKPESLTDGKLKATRADRHEPGRVRWLYQVVAPAIVKASRDGLLDLEEFVNRIIALSANNP
jgi:hypothetical protein